MKKLFALVAVTGLLSFGAFNKTFAQEETAADTTEMTTDSAMAEVVGVMSNLMKVGF